MRISTYFEALLEVLVFFQKRGVIDNDLCIRNAQLQNLIIDRFRGLDGTDGLFQIDVERPKFKRLK